MFLFAFDSLDIMSGKYDWLDGEHEGHWVMTVGSYFPLHEGHLEFLTHVRVNSWFRLKDPTTHLALCTTHTNTVLRKIMQSPMHPGWLEELRLRRYLDFELLADRNLYPEMFGYVPFDLLLQIPEDHDEGLESALRLMDTLNAQLFYVGPDQEDNPWMKDFVALLPSERVVFSKHEYTPLKIHGKDIRRMSPIPPKEI